MQTKVITMFLFVGLFGSSLAYAQGPANFSGANGVPFQYLQQQINALQTDVNQIAAIQARISDLENAVYSLQSQMTAATGDITDLQSQMNALMEEETMLKANLTSLQGALNQGCPTGYTIRRVAQDGSILCETATGTVSSSTSTLFVLSRSTTAYVMPGSTVAGGSQTAVSAVCPTGYMATGGGYLTTASANLTVVQNAPFFDTAGWSGKIVSRDPAVQPFTVYVNCTKLQ